MKIIANYEIYKRIFNFLKAHDVDIVPSGWTSNSYFKRVLATFWPAEELAPHLVQCSELLLAYKRGEVHLSPRHEPSSEGHGNPFDVEVARQQLPQASVPMLEQQPRHPLAKSAGQPGQVPAAVHSQVAADQLTKIAPFPTVTGSGYQPLLPGPAAAVLEADRSAQITQLQSQLAQVLADRTYTAHETREYAEQKSAGAKTNRANSMAARYRSVKSRFSGKCDRSDTTTSPELWKVALAKYQKHCTELELDSLEKVSLIHNMFTGNAETYFYSNLDGIRNGELSSRRSTRGTTPMLISAAFSILSAICTSPTLPQRSAKQPML